MVLSFKTGSFTSRTTTGTDTITGVGFTPKVILLFTAAYTGAEGTDFGNFQFRFGAAVDTTAANQRSWHCFTTEAAGTSDSKQSWQAAAATTAGTSTFTAVGAISAIGADGFTVNWTTNDAVAKLIYYICLGGADIATAKCGEFTGPTATGNQAVTGIGFQPDLVILFGTNTTTDNSFVTGIDWCIGFATTSTNQACTVGVSKNGVTTTATDSYQRTDNTACYALLSTTTPTTKVLEGGLVSMDSDGWTINWTTATATSTKIGYVAISGGNYFVKTITSPTAGTAPVSQATTGVGFLPRGIITLSNNAVSSTSVVANNFFSLGAGSSSSDYRCVFSADKNAAAGTNTDNQNKNNRIINLSNQNPTILADATLTSLDADGFTLSWTTKNATNAYSVITLAAGDGAASTGKTLYIAKGYFKADG